MKIYLASSWRNDMQPAAVAHLRRAGHVVYDFREPDAKHRGFSWSDIDPNWKEWTADQFRAALDHPSAVLAAALDTAALMTADATVLLLPCGRSAHLELGVAVGLQQWTAVVGVGDGQEPKLMYRLCTKVFSSAAWYTEAVTAWLATLECGCGLPGHAPLRLHRPECAQWRRGERGPNGFILDRT